MPESPNEEPSLYPRFLTIFGIGTVLGLGVCGLTGRAGLSAGSFLGAFLVVIGVVGLAITLITLAISRIVDHFQQRGDT